MNIYDIAIAPGQSRQIDVQADYIYFRTGSAGGADTTVVFQPHSGGEAVYLQPGQAYKMPSSLRGKNVSWILRNLKNEGTIVGVILMGEGEFQDNRVSGSVEVIDGGKARTLAGMAFSAAYGSGAAAGKFAQIALFNPANSAKNVVLEAIALSAVDAQAVNVYRIATTLADAGAGSSKNMGAAVGTAAARGSNAATQAAPGPGTNPNWQLSVTANGKDLWVPREPIILPPDRGVVLWSQVAGVGFAASFEWFEESNV